MNLLHKTSLLSCKLVRTPMDVDADLWDEIGSLFEDLNRRLEVNLSISWLQNQILPMLLD